MCDLLTSLLPDDGEAVERDTFGTAEDDSRRIGHQAFRFARQSMMPACAIVRLLTIGSWKKNELVL